MSLELVPFYALAFIAVVSSLAMVGFLRGLANCIVALLVTMLSLAGIYVLLAAPLVAHQITPVWPENTSDKKHGAGSSEPDMLLVNILDSAARY